MRNLIWWLPAIVGAPCLLGACADDESERFVVPFRASFPTRPRATGGTKGSGGAHGGGGANSGGLTGSGGIIPDGSAGAICGCPPLSPLTPCCTSEHTCGYVVGAACFPYVPGTGGAGGGGSGGAGGDSGSGGREGGNDAAPGDASSDRATTDGSVDASTDRAD